MAKDKSKEAAKKSADEQPQGLGEMLVSEGIITQAQLDEAMAVQAAQKDKRGFFGQVLLELGYVKQDDIISFIVKQCKIPHLSLLDYEISKNVLEVIPKEICLEYNLLPIDKLGRTLTVAMVDPLDTTALEAVAKVCPDLRIKPILCNWQHFKTVSSRVFQDKDKPAEEELLDASSFGLKMKKPDQADKEAPAKAAKAADEAPSTEDTGENDAAKKAEATGARGPLVAPQASSLGKGPRAKTHTAPDLTSAAAENIAGVMLEAMAQGVGSERAHSAAPGQPATSTPEMMEALRESLRNATKGITAHPPPAPAPTVSAAKPAEPSVSTRELMEMMREGISSAIQEATANIATQMQTPPGSATPAPPAAPAEPSLSSRELMEVMREGISAAIREGTASMAAQTEQQAPQGPPLTTQQLVEVMREGIATAVQETMAGVATQREVPPLEGPKSGAQVPTADELADVIGASVRDVLHESEAGAVAQANRRTLELQEHDRTKRRQHASISPVDARTRVPKDPDARTGADDHVWAAMTSESLLEGLTFDTFFVGKNNIVTYKLCQAVGQSPGADHNPFFLHGDVGLGKTHLINAIGHAICAESPDLRVGYISASRFASCLADAARDDAVDYFREHYCHWDVLILDDIQFLGGRVDAQEEFFHIFNVLQQAQRQIIIAGDKMPNRLGLLEERLVSRFSGGVVQGIEPPEQETRMTILKHNMESVGDTVKISEDVLALIAMRVPRDVRKMIGSLKKVLAYAEYGEEEVTVEKATEILGHLGIEEAA